jgi:hypothetical protein
MQTELDTQTQQKEAYIATRVMDLNKQISDKLIEKRTGNHGKFAKFTEWMQKHKTARMMTSAGLTGLGLFGMATANAPLYLSTNVLKRSLTGFGSYEMTRSLGVLKSSRMLSKAELNTIDNYLDASKRETTTLRRFNRASILVGSALLTLGPTIFSLIEGHKNAADVVNRGARHIGGARVIGGGSAGAATPPAGAPGGSALTSANTLNIQPVDSNTLPWDFGANTMHTNISNPNVLNSLVNNKDGIVFHGNGLGNGLGAFTSVTIPGQGTFTDIGHFNGAIEYILNNGGTA